MGTLLRKAPALAILLVLLPLSAIAAPISFDVTRQDTGGTIAPLNTVGDDLCPADPTNGCDFDPTDDLLRTNDGIRYQFSVAVDPPGDNVTLTTELKPGLIWDSLPSQCNPLTSTLTGDGSAGSPSLLVCDLGFQSSYAEDLSFVARALGSNPNGTTSGLASAELAGPSSGALVDDLVGVDDVTITAAPRMNLRKTYLTARAENVAGVLGMSVWYTYWIETWQHDTNGNPADDPDPLMGNELVLQPIIFTEDLSGISPNTFVVSCNVSQGTSSSYPYTPFNAAQPNGSVLDAGTNNCSATGVGATGSVQVTHTGADLSLTHYPTQSRAGTAYPGDRRIAAFGTIRIHIPKADFDNSPTPGQIPATNTILGFEPRSITGQPNFLGDDQNAGDDGLDGTAEDKEDNQHSRTFMEGGDGFSHTYRCSVPVIGAHPWCSTTSWASAPTSAAAVWAGDGAVEPNQPFGSYTYFRNGGFGEVNGQTNCAVFDSSLYEVVDIAPGESARCYGAGCGAAANQVIEYGVGYVNGVWPPATGAATGTETAAECDAPATDWYPTTTAARAAGAITKVRIRIISPVTSGQAIGLATALQAVPDNGDPNGTLAETWSSYRNDERVPGWRNCTYNSGTHPAPSHLTNACGDRLYLTRSLARIEKKTVPNDLVNTISAGGQVIFELSPSFTALSGSISDTVDVVDVLPPLFEYVPNSATQAGVAFEPTVAGNIGTGETLTWNLGVLPANSPIDPIRLSVRTPLTTPNATLLDNVATVNVPSDASSPEQRSDQRNITVVAPASMLMSKDVDQVLINRDNAFTWTIGYLNSTTITFNHMEIIDILPFVGDARLPASSYSGTLEVTGLTAQSTNHLFYLSKDTPVGMLNDPGDASQNLATGTVNWCLAGAGGTVNPAATPTIGGPSSNCPANGTEVTAIRLVDDQQLPSATLRNFTISVLTDGNDGGDQYTNQAQGLADGITLRPKTPFALTKVIESPAIGVAKRAASISGNQITYEFLIQNLGDTPFVGLSLVDDLDTTFGAGNYSIATAPSVVTPPASGAVVPNANFTGSSGNTGPVNDNDLIDTSATNSLPVGETAVLAVTVQVDTVVDQGFGLGVYQNSATVSGETPQGATSNDQSDDGTNADQNGNGNGADTGEDDPTPVTLQPAIGTAKTVTSATPVGDGSWDVTYSLIVQNVGAVPLHDVQLEDDLTAPFGTPVATLADLDVPGEYLVTTAPAISVNAASPLGVATGFTGSAPNAGMLDISAGGYLEPGEAITLTFTLRFVPDAAMEPFNNSATATGDTTDDDDTDNSDGVSDLSDDGTDPDADDDGNAGGTDEDDPTPLMIPLIGVAKSLGSVEELSNNVFRITFDIVVANLSTVENATNIQLVEDLAATFAAPVTFTNVTVSSSTLTVNPAFDGSANTDMLSGADNLPPSASGTVSVSADVSTGGNNGPYSNQVTATVSDTPGGTPTASDLSDDGSDPDPNDDGSGGGPDENDPTVFQLPPQQIAVTKQITNVDQLGPTTFELEYQLVVANLSTTIPATNVQVTDNLTAAYPGVTSILVSAPPTVTGDISGANTGFDGAADFNLLVGNEDLGISESATLVFRVVVDFGSAIANGPFINSATASTSGTPGGPPIATDASDDGSDPATGNPGSPSDSGGEDDPTPFTPMQQAIGVAKDLGSVVQVGDDLFDVTFDLRVENLSATEDATYVQVTDDLATTFASVVSMTVQSVTAPGLSTNPAFDGQTDTNLLLGSDTLAPGAIETIALLVRINTGGNNGPYSNQVIATTAATPGGPPVASDASDDGTNPDASGDGDAGGANEDDPTVFQLPPQELGLSKNLTQVNQVGPTTYTLTYEMVVANVSATEPATNVQVSDDLTAAFPAASSIVVSSPVVVSGGLTSSNGAYNGQSDTNLLGGSQTLAVGAQATIVFTATVDFGVTSGTFLNSATASAANSPGGPPITLESSDDGTDPTGNNPGAPGDTGTSDDPTPVTLQPQAIGIAKDLGDVVAISPTEYDVTFDLVVSNLSPDVAATNVQIAEDLSATFTGTSSWSLTSVTPGPTITANPGYDGASDTNLLQGTDTLVVGASETLTIVVRVNTGGNLGPYTNQATATTAASPGGTPLATDLSDAGTNPDSNGDGNSSGGNEDDPNVFQLPPQEIGIAKRVADFRALGGSQYEVDFELIVENLSSIEAATNVQVSDNLLNAFSGLTFAVQSASISTGALTPAGNFDGVVNTNLLAGSDTLAVGQQETLTFTVFVDFSGGTGPFLNQAEATVANSAGGPPIDSDASDSGNDPDANNPGAPGDTGSSDDPTPINIPSMSLAKAATTPVNVSGPLYDVTYTLIARNTGSMPLTNVQVNDALVAALAPATIQSIAVSLTGFGNTAVANSAYDGDADTALLASGAQLPVGGNGVIDIDVRFVNETGAPGTTNTATAISTETPDPISAQANIAVVSADSDGDGVPDDLETGDRDGDGIPDAQDFDPMGYFYCEDNGEILAGGRIEVRTPNGTVTSGVGTANGVTLTDEGTDGFYRFYHDGTPGIYEIVIAQLPPRGVLSSSRLPAGVLDVSSVGTRPVILGSDEFTDTNFLADFSAPANSPYYLQFEFDGGDPDVLLNNIPLTGCAGDPGSITLGKIANDETVTIGDFASYTISVTNNEAFFLTEVTVDDLIPPGFTYVEGSANIVRAGVALPIAGTGTRPITFDVGRLEAGEEIQITYLLRTGAGVVQGNYTNSALAMIRGSVGSNTASADIEVVADPLINITRVVGKVWHDRDGDGWQEPAWVRGLTLYGGPYGDEGRVLGDLTGRRSESENLQETTLSDVRIENWRDDEPLTLASKEGSRFIIHRDGRIEADHRGRMRRGYSGQDLKVSVSDDVLKIVNHGIHEEGLAGVRLATVEGLVIETDAFGRYHIEAIDHVKWDIGSNYIVKLDSASLPDGSTMTTENPRVERLTQGLMSDIDFGVQLPAGVDAIAEEPQTLSETVTRTRAKSQTVNARVSEVRFASGQHDISPAQLTQLRAKIAEVSGKKNLRVRFTGHTDDQGLSARAKAKYSTNKGLSEFRAGEAATYFARELGLTKEQLETRGYGDSQPLASNATPEGMAQNRRVEIDLVYDEETQETYTETVERLTTLPGGPIEKGGVVRAVDDQSLADPRLAFVAEHTTVSAEDGTVDVLVYSNYPAYINELTLEIYAGHDHDLMRPLETVKSKIDGSFDVMHRLTWPVADLEPGETYQYRIVASNADGLRDITRPRKLQALPQSRISVTREATTAEGVYGLNDLNEQTIPVPAGRVRINGHDIDPSHQVLVGQEPMLLDPQGEFILEVHLPTGEYEVPVAMTTQGDAAGERMERNLHVTVGDAYLFMVGLANLTFGSTDLDGAIEPLSADDRYDDNSYTSGRLAFYLKGKIKGKYLVTAQLDTTEDELDNFTDNIQAKDPTSIFRRLEPDQYYPVYGDDSTLRSDTDSQGAFYVRVDWDKSKMLWGNFNTGLTGNEFAQYNRSLYGAQLVYQMPKYTKHNDARFQGELFVSEPQTVAAHNEFAATGGSLYYLNHTDVVRGSEKIWVEVRRRDTLQVLESIPLQPGKDYQFDYFQGRVILNRPLSMVSRDHFANIVRSDSLEGDDVFLMADFEYVAKGFEADDLTVGAAGTAWLTDALGLGATYVKESRTGDDYELKGVDITLRASESTYLKVEVAESDAVQAASQASNDGGLSFNTLKAPGADLSGRALGVEAQINLADVTEKGSGKVRAWYKDREAGFSSSRESGELANTEDVGIEASIRVSDRLDVIAHANQLEREGLLRDRTISVQGNMQITDKVKLGIEGRHEDREDLTGGGADAEATLIGARLGYKASEATELYVEAQTVVDDSGSYEANERATLGIYKTFSEKLGLGMEVSDGSRGSAVTGIIDWRASDAITLNLESGFGRGAQSTAGATLNLADDYQLYGSYGVDADRTQGRSRTVSTVGQRKKFGNRLTVFNEHQWIHGQYDDVATDVFGVDIGLREHWAVSLSFQTNDADVSTQTVKRRAATAGLQYDGEDTRFGTTLERREDENGQTKLEQWLVSSSIEHKFNESWRGVTKFNWSETNDDLGEQSNAARFTEATIGLAYRPVDFDRWNVLSKYTYLFDLVAPQQTFNRPDQRSHVASVEVLYDLSRRWEIGTKLAARRSHIRLNRDQGTWFSNGVNLAVVRARYHMTHQWDGLVEYRYLKTVAVDDVRDGALIGLYRHLGGHMKVGLGYNFTDYSDDLTNLDYDTKGWFLDIVGKW